MDVTLGVETGPNKGRSVQPTLISPIGVGDFETYV